MSSNDSISHSMKNSDSRDHKVERKRQHDLVFCRHCDTWVSKSKFYHHRSRDIYIDATAASWTELEGNEEGGADMDGNRHERGNVAHDVSMQLSEGTAVGRKNK